MKLGGLVMEGMKRILLSLTVTGDCQKVVEFAVDLAVKFSAHLDVLDVVHSPFGYEGWNLPIPFDEEYAQLMKRVRDDLQFMIKKEKERGVSIELLVREGRPADVITEIIEEKKVDLVILPTHEEDRIEHFLFGRVTEKLTRKMPCSILLFRQPETLTAQGSHIRSHLGKDEVV
jgi:universal stress protein A